MKLFTFRRAGVAAPETDCTTTTEVTTAGTTTRGLRRNIAAILIDGVGWPLGQSFLSPQTILPLFIALLTKSTFVVGLVVAVQSIGLIVPQLVIANRLEHMPIKRIYVVVLGVVMERLPFLMLAIGVIAIQSPTALLALFFICWAIANIGTGLNMPAFLGLYAKTIPARLRGRLGGISNSVGMFLAVLGAYITTIILNNTSGLRGFSSIFIIGFVVLTVSLLPLGVMDEPPSEVSATRKTTRDYLRELLPLLRANRSFGRYLVFQVFLQLAYASPSFITAYAVLKLGVTTATVGVFTAILMGATAVGSLLLGLIADRHGYRSIFLIAAAFSTAAYAILAFLPPLAVVYLCVALVGILLGTQFMGNNMAMEYCPPDKAGTYTAIVVTASTPVRVVGPVLLGILADKVSMILVFGVVALVSLLAFGYLLFLVSDPRHRQPVS